MQNINPQIFRAYDIRGIYPTDIDEDLVYRAAQGYVKLLNPKTVVLGNDVRISGKVLADAAIQGLIDAGVDVVYIGEISTDMMYFTVSHYDYDGGIAISASHNPREYNGMKMVRKGDNPVAGDSGMEDIKNFVLSGGKIVKSEKGKIIEKHILEDYCNMVLSFLKSPLQKNYRIVANANFGMSGMALERLIDIGNLPIEVIPENFKPDGSFPKGRPDPILPTLRKEMEDEIKKDNVSFGVAWDGDADRCLFYDENGEFLSGYYTTAVLAKHFLKHYPGASIYCDPRLIWAIRDVVNEMGGKLFIGKAGHSFIKELMRKEDIYFGGEMSGHYYFKDNFYSDNGMIPLIILLQILENHDQISDLYDPIRNKYFISGEIDIEVKDYSKIFERVKEKYIEGANFSDLDGISFEYSNWRFNLRPSNTEPLIRLNVESYDQMLTDEKTKEIMDLINSSN